jgi:hypothetical protein
MLRVEVHWTDSGLIRSNGWEPLEKIISEAKISDVVTVGFLAHETPDEVYIALSADFSHNHFFGTQVIHRKNINAMHVLRVRHMNMAERYPGDADYRPEITQGEGNPHPPVRRHEQTYIADKWENAD